MALPPSHIFVVRHGNRLDAADKRWHLSSPTPYDPPLTYGGFLQARQVGNHIANILQQSNDDDHISSRPKEGRRRRRFKVMIHSSPFLRCVQTSVGISSGLAQASPDSSYDPAQVLVSPPPVDGKPTEHKTATLRLDSFLGEWLSPEYFENITPPPSSSLMLAGAKADLLKREDYSRYTNFEASDHRAALGNTSGSLWNGSPTQTPVSSQASDGSGTFSTRALASALSGQLDERRGYVAPKPTYAASTGGKIPDGFVAHARDKCTVVDYQWDSMRSPLRFGDGGTLGEEWTSMHQRFRAGAKNLLNWYWSGDDPTRPVALPKQQSQLYTQDGQEDDELLETVVVIVSHGAGCNALIGAITNQPVLMDVGIASITMAARKPDLVPIPSHLAFADWKPIPVDQMYDIRLSATTEHLHATPSGTPVRQGSVGSRSSYSRGRNATLSHGSGGPVLGSFTYSNPIPTTSGSRSSSLSGAAGLSMNRDSSASRHRGGSIGRSALSIQVNGSGEDTKGPGLSEIDESQFKESLDEPEPPLITTPRRLPSQRMTSGLNGLKSPTHGTASVNGNSRGSAPVFSSSPQGLWKPAPVLKFMDDETAVESDDELCSMLPSLDQRRFSQLPGLEDPPSPKSTEPSAPPSPVKSGRGPFLAAPIKLQTNLEIRKPAEQISITQLGGGMGGLWGAPRSPDEAEKLRDFAHPKRRWTLNDPV